MKAKRKWSGREEHLFYENLSDKQIAERTGRTLYSVQKKRSRINGEPYVGVRVPEPLSQREKMARLYKLAQDLGVKLLV